jgi:hypothetical protein
MPPGAIAEVLSAQRDWLKRKLEDGTLDCAYGFIGGGGVGIANADSIEGVHALLVQSPGFAIGDNEVRPWATSTRRSKPASSPCGELRA